MHQLSLFDYIEPITIVPLPAVEQTSKHSVETLAYAAGFVDGEGCIAIKKTQRVCVNPSYLLYVSASNTNQNSIEWLKNNFGGCITDRSSYPSRQKEGWRPIWVWVINGEGARQFLVQILPYLRIKHHQADVAIQFQDYSITHPMCNLSYSMRQEIANRREVYRQHINSFHGSKGQWERNEEFPVEDIPHTNNPRAILAYAAGLVDGEGCIIISVDMPTSERGDGKRTAPSHCLRFNLTNTDLPIIEWLYTTFGGGIARNKNPKAVTNGDAPAHEWKLSGEKAKTFLEKIEPYMIIKKRQAALAIEFQTYNKEHSRHVIANQTQKVVDRKEEYRQRLNSMNLIRKPVTSIYTQLVSHDIPPF